MQGIPAVEADTVGYDYSNQSKSKMFYTHMMFCAIFCIKKTYFFLGEGGGVAGTVLAETAI